MVEPNVEITGSDELVIAESMRRRGELTQFIFTFLVKFELGEFFTL
jgi:hypothetical protein